MELAKAHIAYEYRGGQKLFERAHIKDALAFLRLRHNFGGMSAWIRVLTMFKGIGFKTASNIAMAAAANASSGWDGLSQSLGLRLSKRAIDGWEEFTAIWRKIMFVGLDAKKLLSVLLDSWYRRYLEAVYTNAKDREQDLKELAAFAGQFASLGDFLAETALREEWGGGSAEKGLENSGDKLVLSTIHQAKGLEWDAVIILNLNEGSFPNESNVNGIGELEEERRLFYVAVTRARQYLYLLSMSADNFGRTLPPSLFLRELERDLMETDELAQTDSFHSRHRGGELPVISAEDGVKIKPGEFLIDIDSL
jgi:DNA helicase-2/ATP-dependent DNA helicase PcrA